MPSYRDLADTRLCRFSSGALTTFTIAASLLLGGSACQRAPLAVDVSAPVGQPAQTAPHSDRRPGTLGTEIAPIAAALTIGSTASPETTTAEGTALDVGRSVLINDVASMSGITLQGVLQQITTQAATSVTGLGLFQQLWDAQRSAPGLDATTPHCTGTLNGFPLTCNRAEGAQATANPFGTDSASYATTALVNRVDLIPLDGSDCGEYRIVFGKRSANSGDRAFMIFEAVLPNPKPERGLEGCRPVQTFWRDLSTVVAPNVRAQRLAQFYLQGLPGFRPVVHFLNYGSGVGSGGRVRTNQFMQGPWLLREFELQKQCPNNACRLLAIPGTDKTNPHFTLFNTTATDARTIRFQSAFVKTVASLAVPDLNRFFMEIPDEFNAGQSDSQTFPGEHYGILFDQTSTSSFRTAIQTELTRIGSALTPSDIVNRATTQSCAGCHMLSNSSALGGGLTWPTTVSNRNGGFVHISEILDTSTGTFQLSPALTSVFLPHRARTMAGFLNRPATPVAAQRTTTPPTIDGLLNEASWGAGTEATKVVLGPGSDNSAVWSVTWDESNLYVGVRVTDASTRNDSGTSPWLDDTVEVWVDGDNDKAVDYSANDRQFFKRWNDSGLTERTGQTSGVSHAVATIAGGYSVELSIPWSHFGGTATVGRVLGFGVGYDDDDDGDDREGQVISSGTADNWRDLSALASIVLEGAPAAETGLITAARTTADIVVDGQLNELEWTFPASSDKGVIGSPNNTSTFGALWTDAGLFVAVRVLDSDVRNDSPEVWEDDSVEVYLDPTFNRGTTYDAFDRQFIKGVGDTTVLENGVISTSTVQHATASFAGGYSAEFFIPWSSIGISPNVGKVLGFDIGVNDDDGGGLREHQTMWQGTADNWFNPSSFGRLRLGQ